MFFADYLPGDAALSGGLMVFTNRTNGWVNTGSTSISGICWPHVNGRLLIDHSVVMPTPIEDE